MHARGRSECDVSDALRLEIERCARAEGSRDRLQVRQRKLGSEVAEQWRSLRLGGRLMTALIGSAAVYKLARGLRRLMGKSIEPAQVSEVEPLDAGWPAHEAADGMPHREEWSAQVARRKQVEAELREAWLGVGALLWRARIAGGFTPGTWRAALGGGVSSLRTSLKRVRAAATASERPLAPGSTLAPKGSRRALTAVVRGGRLSGRLAAWRLSRRLDGVEVVFVATGSPPAVRDGPGDVLFLDAGVRVESPAWLQQLRDILLADPGLAAVAPVTVSESGEPVDGAWEIDWEGGAPQPRMVGAWGGDGVGAAGDGSATRDATLVGGSCVLYRGEALDDVPDPIGSAGNQWSFDYGVALREMGWRFALAPLVARRPPSSADADRGGGPHDLIRIWGPLLRRRILGDLVRGGGDWSKRVARVALALEGGADDGLGGWVTDLGWKKTSRLREADFVLNIEGDGRDRSLVVGWPGDRQRAPCRARCSFPASGEQLREALLGMIEAPSFCLEIGAPDIATARAGGDLALAEALAGALGRRGHPTFVQDGSATSSAAGSSLDVRLHLRGRRRRRLNPGQLNVIWHMSHPEEVSRDELNEYDLALVASRPYARSLASELDTPVAPFLQFTDPERFRPAPDPTAASRLLFVGNWRGQFRLSVWSALRCGHAVALYGEGWRLLAPEHVREDHVPNDELPRLYSSAEIVLCDHWPEMRELGFIANRVFDVLACEGFLLSDHFDALEEELGGCLETYRTADDLDREIELNLKDAGRRHAIARRGREVVLRKHSVDHRADQLVALIGPLS